MPNIEPGEVLARACIGAARTNIFLVSVSIPHYMGEYRDYQCACIAQQTIIAQENAGKISHACADRAFAYLREATGFYDL